MECRYWNFNELMNRIFSLNCNTNCMNCKGKAVGNCTKRFNFLVLLIEKT